MDGRNHRRDEEGEEKNRVPGNQNTGTGDRENQNQESQRRRRENLVRHQISEKGADHLLRPYLADRIGRSKLQVHKNQWRNEKHCIRGRRAAVFFVKKQMDCRQDDLTCVGGGGQPVNCLDSASSSAFVIRGSRSSRASISFTFSRSALVSGCFGTNREQQSS